MLPGQSCAHSALDEAGAIAVERPAELARGLGREVLHQERDVLAPLAQRRQHDRNTFRR